MTKCSITKCQNTKGLFLAFCLAHYTRLNNINRNILREPWINTIMYAYANNRLISVLYKNIENFKDS